MKNILKIFFAAFAVFCSNLPVAILAHFSKTVRALNTLPIVFAEKASIKAKTRTGIAVPIP